MAVLESADTPVTSWVNAFFFWTDQMKHAIGTKTLSRQPHASLATRVTSWVDAFFFWTDKIKHAVGIKTSSHSRDQASSQPHAPLADGQPGRTPLSTQKQDKLLEHGFNVSSLASIAMVPTAQLQQSAPVAPGFILPFS